MTSLNSRENWYIILQNKLGNQIWIEERLIKFYPNNNLHFDVIFLPTLSKIIGVSNYGVVHKVFSNSHVKLSKSISLPIND